ncbi:PsbQ-like protein 3 chloroplastic [Bienertia sinuspersici]
MALASMVPGSSKQCLGQVFNCCRVSSPIAKVNPNKLQPYISRRMGGIAVITSLFLSREAITSNKTANSFEFRMTVPDQTVEEAQSMIRDHAQALLDVKSLIDLESWREAQRELRKSSAYLKQDIYTIIQSKEGSIRPLLRKLYFNLFSNVTKLDYAARDKDITQVKECYNDIVADLNDILARLE